MTKNSLCTVDGCLVAQSLYPSEDEQCVGSEKLVLHAVRSCKLSSSSCEEDLLHANIVRTFNIQSMCVCVILRISKVQTNYAQ